MGGNSWLLITRFTNDNEVLYSETRNAPKQEIALEKEKSKKCK